MAAHSLTKVKNEIERGRDLLSKAGTDLVEVQKGVHAAADAGLFLNEALAGEVDVDHELIAATEALIRATARALPLLQRAELDVLEHVAGAEQEEVPLEPAAVRRLAEARARSMSATIDLSRGLAKVYEKAFAAMGA